MKIEVITSVDMGNVKAICPMIDGNLLVYALPGSLKVYNKHGAWLNKEFPMPCEHPNDNEKLNMLHLKIGYKPYVVFLCSTCKAFYLINPVSKQSTTAWKGDKGPHDVICRGPDSSLFVKNGYTGIVWRLDCSEENFKKIGELAVGLSQIAAMTFEQSENLLIVSNHTHSREDVYVKAVKVDTGEAMWKIGPGQVGDKFPILGMCNNGQGVVLLAEFDAHCITIVDAKTGRIVKQELKENNDIKHPTLLAWFDNQPNFAMKQLNGVSFCRIE